MKKLVALALLLCSSAAHAQSVSIPGAQIAGTPQQNHIAVWQNPTTLSDSGVPLTGLTTGVISVSLSTSDINVFSTGGLVTTSGALIFNLLSQSSNLVLAGPATGGTAIPAFRSLTGADFQNQTANTFFGGPTSGSPATPGFRTLTNADLPAPTLTALGGVEAVLTTASNWIDSISTFGIPHKSQPAFSDLSGGISCSQAPALTGAVTTLTDSCVTSIPSNSLTNGELAVMSGGSVKGYVGSGTGQPVDLSPSAIIDTLPGNVLSAGNTLARASTGWVQVAPATSGYIWQSNGKGAIPSWVAGGFFSILSTQAFTSNGTYTPTSGMKYALVIATGGGGGGGNGSTPAPYAGGGGGGAGGTAIGVFSAATIGASQSVTIGGGGAAATGGGNTTFGALLTGSGGNGGASGSGSSNGAGAVGGSATGGIIQSSGGDGSSAAGGDTADNLGSSGGLGGSSFWGGGGHGASGGTGGSGSSAAANAWGGGGGGGGSGAGAAGKGGIVWVIEFD